MSNLVAFARDLLASHGAAVEELTAEGGVEIEALLPEGLSAQLGLPEIVRFTEGQCSADKLRLAYGSEFLERMVGLATATRPLACATLSTPLPRTSDPVATALGHYSALNGVLRPTEAPPTEDWGGYLVADFRYIADADEHREGLLRVGFNEAVGADLATVHGITGDPDLRPGGNNAPLADAPQDLLKLAHAAARRSLRAEVAPLADSVRRRHLRDRSRLSSYYTGLQTAMDRQLERMRRRGASAQELQVRQAKRDELGAEFERKLQDLKTRYKLQVKLDLVALLRVEIQVRRIPLQAQRRSQKRTITIYQSGAMRGFEPLRCQACGVSIFSFALCDQQLHLLCADCDKARASARHCPVCNPRSRRG